jgi:hypothetical protein
MELTMKKPVVREIPAAISDKGAVKVGNYTPLFPPPAQRTEQSKQ